jgi:hypothetical protein
MVLLIPCPSGCCVGFDAAVVCAVAGFRLDHRHARPISAFGMAAVQDDHRFHRVATFPACALAAARDDHPLLRGA